MNIQKEIIIPIDSRDVIRDKEHAFIPRLINATEKRSESDINIRSKIKAYESSNNRTGRFENVPNRLTPVSS